MVLSVNAHGLELEPYPLDRNVILFSHATLGFECFQVLTLNNIVADYMTCIALSNTAHECVENLPRLCTVG